MPQNDIPVIKLSGKALENKAALKALFSAVRGKKVIFVHGGGVEVDALLKKLDLKTEKIDGIRVSPPEQMPYITAALAGLCNRYLQADAKACGLNPLGLIATDGNSVTLSAFGKKFGNVATALPENGEFLSLLLENKITPFIASVGIDEKGDMYNINADDVALAIARIFNAPLFFISDVKGVKDANGNIIENLSEEMAFELINQKVITDGMIVKVKTALDAAKLTHRPVFIASLTDPELISNLFSLRRIGTSFSAR
ncbi:acetylglutamate kinase [Succinatimonas hippei]|uniref:Acetylglutamate kinase n=1 Tax=Succinatimonas hippei (strain DSM 22608 / JCM 16073 / KCTC 15190 / YIT 12066) TaxID=762983 RepID=E8LKP5_SUCHY|nr:acetylglutamate kinase [Succinatimonas hippei]EFY06925.1 acetylglutamate kinase [Succinatimonas hippei YIT 12066]MCL1603876.1 acetylglutamate kinase [Succinatimonas hippei]MDM8120768.1 acetylglutamate kinase [Succinatimonas hippei]